MPGRLLPGSLQPITIVEEDERMRRVFVPHKSPAHRLACLSLYRDLLRQCDSLALQVGHHGLKLPATALKDIIRYRFRRDASVDRLLPFSAITSALQAGHAHLILLRKATAGSNGALAQIIATLKATSADLTSKLSRAALRQHQPTPSLKRDQYRLRHEAEVSSKDLQTPPTNVPGALGPPLPLSQLKDQTRIVPHLVVTSVGNIPLLRYKIGRPPPWLRRIVWSKQKEEILSIQHADALIQEHDMGLQEDAWEKLVYMQAKEANLLVSSTNGKRNGNERVDFELPGDGPESYSYWPNQVREESYAQFEKRRWNYAVRGWRLWQKVKRERWLTERETIPARLANVVRDAQRLQREVVRVDSAVRSARQANAAADEVAAGSPGDDNPFPTQTPQPGRSTSVRSNEEAKELAAQCKALGPLHVPVEWSLKVVDQKMPHYLEQGAKRWRVSGEVDRDVDYGLDGDAEFGHRGDEGDGWATRERQEVLLW